MATQPTLEQQLASIMEGFALDTLQLSAQREPDGSFRFYVAFHPVEGGCVFSEYMNKPTVHEAIASGIDVLNRKRMASASVAPLPAMELTA